MAAQHTPLGALRQTEGGPLRPPGGTAAVAAGARQLHQPRALRRLVGAHPCALVRVGLTLRVLGRSRSESCWPWPPASRSRGGKPGAWAGFGAAWPAPRASPCWLPWMSRRAVPTPSALGSPREPRRPAGMRAGPPRAGRRLSMRSGSAAGGGRPGAEEILQVRRVAADGGYSTKTFVERVRALGLHTVGRLARIRSCAFATPDTTRGTRGASGSSTAASTAATRCTWPARP